MATLRQAARARAGSAKASARSRGDRPHSAERGQILPLVGVIAIVFLATGMLVFWLGLSTSMKTDAQTGADAAALAAEQRLLIVLSTPPVPPLPVAEAEACASAADYATRNNSHVLSCNLVPAASSLAAYDMQVEVSDTQVMPQGSPAAGQAALARAQASDDPYSQASPAILEKTSTADCTPSVGSAPAFVSHGGQDGGQPGFFPASGGDYTRGCEQQLAGYLDALGRGLAPPRHLTGVSGYVGSNQPAPGDLVATAHQCGAASTTLGLRGVSDSTLAQYHLARPFAGKPDEIEIAGIGCGQQTTSVDSPTQGSVGFGNTNVHLVPWGGGPNGAGLLFGGGGVTAINYSQMQIGCMLYSAAQQLHVDHNVLLALFMAAWAESTMQDLGYSGQLDSLGVLQQRTSMGWGSPAQEMNPFDAAMMFLIGDQSNSPYYNGRGSSPGAIYLDRQSPGIPPWVLAQGVQGSKFADGSNYAAQMGAAQTMLSQIQGGACGKH